MKTKIPKGFSLIHKGRLKLISCDAISAIPGFTQTFTTRIGGVSKSPFGSLNIGKHTEDDDKKIAKNILLMEKALGIRYVSAARQVHGDGVVVIKSCGNNHKSRITNPKIKKSQYLLFEVNPESGIQNLELNKILDTEADALITDIPGLAVGVRVADCVGTVIIDPVNKVIAAVHSGWRGIANKIPAKTIKIMKNEFGSNPKDLIAAVSPAIGPCCYQVGPEVYKLQKQKVFSTIFKKKADGIYMNLWQGAKNLLIAEGLKVKNIHICSMCTSDNPELFYSHRRDKGVTGRMMVLGVYKAEPKAHSPRFDFT